MSQQQALQRALRAWGLSSPAALPLATKNLTARCRDARGRAVFVKCPPNPFDRGVEREARAIAHVAERVSRGLLRVPRIVGFDVKAQALALAWVPGASLYAANTRRSAPLAAIRAAARGLGALHRATWADAPEWAAPPEDTLIDCFVWTRPTFVTRLSIDGMKLIGSLQADRKAVAALIALKNQPPQCLIHGDAKALNVLLSRGGAPFLIDWELVQFGDPAQDIGSFWGDYIRCCVAPESESERLDARELRAVERALWAGYSSAGGPVDRPLKRRARQWAGASLLFYAHAMVLHSGSLTDDSSRLFYEAKKLLRGGR